MPTIEKRQESPAWRQCGLQIDASVRRALKAEAALAGVTMSEAMHRLLVESLRNRGYSLHLEPEEGAA